MRVFMSEKYLYKDLSKEIVGAAFNVYNAIGHGLREVEYQRALAKEFTLLGIEYTREVPLNFVYKGEVIKKVYADFLVDGSVLVELKVRKRLGYVDFKQVQGYLRLADKKLAIILYFTSTGVLFRRVLSSKKIS